MTHALVVHSSLFCILSRRVKTPTKRYWPSILVLILEDIRSHRVRVDLVPQRLFQICNKNECRVEGVVFRGKVTDRPRVQDRLSWRKKRCRGKKRGKIVCYWQWNAFTLHSKT